MPVTLGLASSHAPFLLSPAGTWPQIHKGLVGEVPQPSRLATETQDVIDGYLTRIQAGFARIRAELERARPDALILIGDDQDEVFSGAFIPPFAMFLGSEAEGTASINWIGEKNEDNRIRFDCAAGLARATLDGLSERGFDVGFIEQLTPLGRPERGLSHAFTRIARMTGLHLLGIPVIIVFLNAYHPPMPSAQRCYAFGEAIRDIFADRPERIALYGSGGLSHDPMGSRAGWVDEPLDRWVLDRISRGESAKLKQLFTIDSDALSGGTGEIRCWIAVAGAFPGHRAEVIDYIPSAMALTGISFACWS